MNSLKPDLDRRAVLRHHLYHIAKIRPGADVAPRECLIVDISDEGVRIYVVGFEVAEEFVGSEVARVAGVYAHRSSEKPTSFS